MKIFTIADVPDALAQAWLQHLRDFDTAHPGCHFEVVAEAPAMSLTEIVETMRVNPGLSVTQVFERFADHVTGELTKDPAAWERRS